MFPLLLLFLHYSAASPLAKNSGDDTAPIWQVCSGVRCKDGEICAVNNLGPSCFAHCVPAGEITCNNVDCFPDKTCINEEVVCITAPCYPAPTCIPFGYDQNDGYGVPTKPVLCKRPPPDNYGAKPPPYKPGPSSPPSKPVYGGTPPSYPPGHNDGSVPTWKACAGVKCKQPGYVCAINIFGPSCIAHCIEGGDYTCDNVDCKPGESCVNQEVVCVTTPCYPLPVCVPKGKGPNDGSNPLPDTCQPAKPDTYPPPSCHPKPPVKPPAYGNTPPPRPPGYGTDTTPSPPACYPPCKTGFHCTITVVGNVCIPGEACTPPLPPCVVGKVCTMAADGTKSCVDIPGFTPPTEPTTDPTTPPTLTCANALCMVGYHCVETPTGPNCVPDNCGKNEFWAPCGNQCEGRCQDQCFIRPCAEICNPGACACQPDFWRHTKTGQCVPREKCEECGGGDAYPTPPTPYPTVTTSEPTNTCKNVKCSAGFHCVDQPSGPVCVPDKCGPHEILDPCSNLCEGKCATAFGKPPPCPKICIGPTCACAEGFYRNDKNQCVTKKECKSYVPGPSPGVCNILCIKGTHCVVTPSGPQCIPGDACTPPLPPCAFGLYCSMAPDGSKSCVPPVSGTTPTTEPTTEPTTPQTLTCANALCMVGYHCVETPTGPNCVPDNCGENEFWAPCGNQCEGRCQDQCFIRPCLDICNPGACACQPNFWRHTKTGKCVPREKCVECGGSDAYPTPPTPYPTVTTPEPTNTCKNVKCSAGFHCVDQPSGPLCVPDDTCTPPVIECPPGHKCVQPTDPKSQTCVPVSKPNTCSLPAIDCPPGHKCVQPTDPKSQTCVPVSTPNTCTPHILKCPPGHICVQPTDPKSQTCVPIIKPDTCIPPALKCPPGQKCIQPTDAKSQTCVPVTPTNCFPPILKCPPGTKCIQPTDPQSQTCVPVTIPNTCTPPILKCPPGQKCIQPTDPKSQICVPISKPNTCSLPAIECPPGHKCVQPTDPQSQTCVPITTPTNCFPPILKCPPGTKCVQPTDPQSQTCVPVSTPNFCTPPALKCPPGHRCVQPTDPQSQTCVPISTPNTCTPPILKCPPGQKCIQPTDPKSQTCVPISKPNTCSLPAIECPPGHKCVQPNDPQSQTCVPVSTPTNCFPPILKCPPGTKCVQPTDPQSQTCVPISTPNTCTPPALKCPPGQKCVQPTDPKSQTCVPVTTPNTCTPPILKCPPGQKCIQPTDPKSQTCVPVSKPNTCTPPILKCPLGQKCIQPTDPKSQICVPASKPGNPYTTGIPSNMKPPGVNPCAAVLCAAPSTCVVVDGEAQCITPMISENPYN